MASLFRAVSHSGAAVVYAVDSTDIVKSAEQIHKTSATASAALGRLLTAASLMGAMSKSEQESLTLRIKADGTVGSLVAVSDSLGNVRGYCDHPLADLPANKDTGKLDVKGIVGTNGTLYVIRDLGMKEPYVGMTPIVSGEIAEDITEYFAVSQQTPTACALGVLVDTDLSIKKAGGYILQLLPGANEDEISLVERNVKNVGAITAELDGGVSIKDIALRLLEGLEPEILSETQVEYFCPCSEQRTKRMLISLGREELESLEKEKDEIEVVCNFCGKTYNFFASEILKSILQ